MLSFIWGGKAQRIRKEHLQRSRSDGGLALPNFKYYYWAANISKLVSWTHNPDLDWCQNEASSCPDTSLQALITSSLPINYNRYTSNPIVRNTLKIWSQFRSSFNLKELSLYTLLRKNHLFPLQWQTQPTPCGLNRDSLDWKISIWTVSLLTSGIGV